MTQDSSVPKKKLLTRDRFVSQEVSQWSKHLQRIQSEVTVRINTRKAITRRHAGTLATGDKGELAQSFRILNFPPHLSGPSNVPFRIHSQDWFNTSMSHIWLHYRFRSWCSAYKACVCVSVKYGAILFSEQRAGTGEHSYDVHHLPIR